MGMKPVTQADGGLLESFSNSMFDTIKEIHSKLPVIDELRIKLAAIDGVDLNNFSHTGLSNRTAVDSHPISAITGLQTALSNLELNKVAVAVGMGLSQNSFTDSYKTTLDNLNTTLSGKANVSHTHNQSDITGLSSALANKQDTLVSGISIKTVNGNSLLGSGNIVITSGSTDHSTLTNRNVADSHTIAAITGLQTTLDGKASTANATTTVAGLMSNTDKTKLDGVASNATVNSSDATLLNRANHTGSQATSTITGLDSALTAKQATLVSGTNIKTVNGVTLLGSGDIVISGGGGGITDHSALTNRTVVDSHPISAITGLQAELDSKASTSVATTLVTGLMSNTDKTKLDGIAASATVNSSDATLLNRANHTGAQATSTITGLDTALAGKASTAVATTSTSGLMSNTDKTKIDGVSAGATVNSTDAALRDRSTHTGAQAISTVTGLQTALDAKVTDSVNIKRIHVGTTAPTDTSMLWLDIN